MALIEWRQQFELGLPGVDHEHRELIAMINGLHRMLHEENGMSALEFLGEIDTRISAHFALEELEMREHRYAGYAAHKADHERLLNEIGDMLERESSGKRFDEAELSKLLAEWFGEHFATHDAALHKALKHH